MLGHFRQRFVDGNAYQCIIQVINISDCHLLYNHLHIIKKIFLCNVYRLFLWWYRSLRCEERATTLHRLLWTLWWWAMWPIGLLPFSSPDSKTQVSFSGRCRRKLFTLSSSSPKPLGPISTKLGTKGVQLCSNEGSRPFLKGEITK